MGNGMCSRRQKRIVQALVLLAVVAGLVYGALLNYDLQNRLRRADALAAKYQQHQESLSAQLQVVYEHRSRLEKSLQKERLELKKAREDHLVYKLEAQETLNKGRQDSNARYNALSVQHQMLKNQHEELRKQHGELQTEHQKLGEDLTKTFSDHKEKYLHLQQEKEQESSKLKESIYNLREENKQLRKVHQDVHTQLQDVKNQVEEFMQLKNALNKVPSLRHLERSTQTTIPRAMPSVSSLQITAQEYVALNKLTQTNVQTQQEHEHEGIVEQRKTNIEKEHKDIERAELHKANENTGLPLEAEPTTEHPVEVEEEHKKELEEEEMEQVGKPERLEEDQDQIQEEQLSEDEHGAAANEEHEEETNILNEHEKRDQSVKPIIKSKSAYEEQVEQQKLAGQQEEQARYLKWHQDSLDHQRLREHVNRQQQLHENHLDMEKPNKLKESHIADKMGGHEQYDHLDHDIVQGEEEQHLQEEGAYERDNHQDEAEDADDAVKNLKEERAMDRQPMQHEQAPADDVNPADDPNNQGEDEFEEAEQEREENLPDDNEEQKQLQEGQAEKQEHLVMAGNPDQQEDNADEQYQEEGEEEVQEDLTEERKREQNGDEPYAENEENVVRKRHEALQEEPRENHDDNYEEEEEEEEDGAKNRRAEM